MTTRYRTNIMLDNDLYRKLRNIVYAQKHLKGIKNASMSSIIDSAIREYFANHNKELNELLEDYIKKGAKIDRI